jgi:MOSC domain-containing protein YiiM
MDEPQAATMQVPKPEPSRHLSQAELERRLSNLTELTELAPGAHDAGRVVLLVARPGGDQRATPKRAHLSAATGMTGDRWGAERRATRDNQITAIRSSVAEVIANGQDLTLFGDNLFLDLDLSEANLPAGTRLQAGKALLEVTPEPHDGCLKFRGRFGADALRVVSKRAATRPNLRGIHLKVVEDGDVCVGDEVRVIRE